MELSFQKTIALLLGFGSILFLIAAFLPVSRIYAEPLADRKIEIIRSMWGIWYISQVLFGLGAVITVAALGIQTYHFRNIPGSQWPQLAITLMLVGSAIWCWHLGERMINPKAFAHNLNTPFLFITYTLLTQIGLVIFGFFLLKTGISIWVGWMFVISSAIFFLLMVIAKDMPPFVYYIITGTASIMLYSKRNGINIKHFQ